jgi:DNA-binding XRE family transcriptional regulator
MGDRNQHEITTDEAAKLIGRKPQTLRAWAASESGLLKPCRKSGKSLLRTMQEYFDGFYSRL